MNFDLDGDALSTLKELIEKQKRPPCPKCGQYHDPVCDLNKLKVTDVWYFRSRSIDRETLEERGIWWNAYIPLFEHIRVETPYLADEDYLGLLDFARRVLKYHGYRPRFLRMDDCTELVPWLGL